MNALHASAHDGARALALPTGAHGRGAPRRRGLNSAVVGVRPVRGGVGALLLRFLEYFSGTSPDALHAVVVDSESRLQAKQLSRLKLLAEHLAPPASPSAVPSTPPAVPDDEPSQGRAHPGASHGRGGGASNGRGAHHGVTSRGPYEEAVYAAASLLVQEPR